MLGLGAVIQAGVPVVFDSKNPSAHPRQGPFYRQVIQFATPLLQFDFVQYPLVMTSPWLQERHMTGEAQLAQRLQP